MNRLAVALALGVALLLGSAASAYAAASTAGYSFVLPRFQGDIYSSDKTVAAYKDFGVLHKYSGGYPVAFTVCTTGKSALGSRVTVYPGGSQPDLIDLWYNASSSARTIKVRVESAKANVVTILAQGTWRWNY